MYKGPVGCHIDVCGSPGPCQQCGMMTDFTCCPIVYHAIFPSVPSHNWTLLVLLALSCLLCLSLPYLLALAYLVCLALLYLLALPFLFCLALYSPTYLALPYLLDLSYLLCLTLLSFSDIMRTRTSAIVNVFARVFS